MARFWHNFPGNGLGSTGQREMAHGLGPDYQLIPPPPAPPVTGTPLTFIGPQQGDVKLFQTIDDGEINVQLGLVEMSAGLETAAYLSMFGGDEDLKEWWGNLSETDPARQYRSETQQILDAVPATTANLLRIKDAVGRDLAWFTEENIASTMDISLSIPALGRVGIAIALEAAGVLTEFEFVESAGGGVSSDATDSFTMISGKANSLIPGTSDVKLFQTIDDGEISIEGGIVEMSGGLETAAYLSLFGGDEDLKEWWGNISETDPARRYRSETQQILDTVPATSSNLIRIEDAALRDLRWFINENIASTIDVSASIPAPGRVSIAGIIEADGVLSEFDFVENWEAAT